MASAAYSEELTCPTCRTFFTDPVTLPCGHSFCRECVAAPRCPRCEAAVPPEAGRGLPTSLTLQRLADALKQETGSERPEAAELCPEHEEKLKLFCVTDQQLTCIVCRDEEKHDGHKFKTTKEASASLRRELEEDVQGLRGDVASTESLAQTQRAAMARTKEKSQQLATQIHRQFEEMHQFLMKREDEVKNDLRCQEEATVEGMRASLDAMETALSESRESEAELTAVLQIEDSEGLLRSWTQGNSGTAPSRPSRPRAKALHVVDTSLSLGPYESHLQFFVWKEMLQVIQPRAEPLSLKSTSADVTVSDDGRSLFCTPKSEQAPPGLFSGFGANVRSGKIAVRRSPAASGQNTGYSLTPAASGLHTGYSLTPAASGLHTGYSLTPAASGLHTGYSLTPAASGLHTGYSLTPAASGLHTCYSFGTPAALGQNTGFSFGTSAALGQNTMLNFGLTPAASGLNAGSGFVFPALSITRHVFSVNEFTSGQHYWEAEVGHRDYWALGIKDHFLKFDGQKYSACSPKTTTELALGARPRKIGIYLNFSSRKLSFYDADNMTRIHTLRSGPMSTPLSAYFNIRGTTPDCNPLTACWY